MPITVRPISTDDLPAFLDAMTTGFLERPDVDKVAAEVAPLWDLSRTWAARDGDRIVGTFRSWGTEVTVPGGRQLPASAVTNVTVLPSHRRRGVLRSMIAADHGASRERGEVLSLLYAAEYPIYGRFGYGSCSRLAVITLDSNSTGFHAPATGSIELVRPNVEWRDRIHAIYDTWRLTHAAEIRRRDYRWDRDLGLRDVAWGTRWKGFLALHRDDSGEIDGYVRYRADDKWEQGQPRATLTVDEMIGLTESAVHALWRFLAEVDWVARVKAENRPAADRLPWLLTNARAAVVSELADGMWARLLDVPSALAARTYEHEGRIVIEANDSEVAGGRIRVELDAGPDGATAKVTKKAADLTVDVAALGAAYFGGTRLADAAIAAGADEHSAGALGLADRLLRTADDPWTSTFF